jgi:uncharacterized protein (TIGR02246 family)
MKRILTVLIALAMVVPVVGAQDKNKAKTGSDTSKTTSKRADPVEEANAAIDRWSAAYSANDVAALVKNYWPDAILLGTKSPIISTGSDAIQKYFTDLKLQGSGNKNTIQERHSIRVDDNAVLVTGFYEFTRMQEGKPVPGPSRFTMLMTKRGDEWRIAHHHSSPHVMPQ